jgi:hypothetical protein
MMWMARMCKDCKQRRCVSAMVSGPDQRVLTRRGSLVGLERLQKESLSRSHFLVRRAGENLAV